MREIPEKQLQLLLGDLARVREYGELVAGERHVGEDVADDVTECGHFSQTIARAGP